MNRLSVTDVLLIVLLTLVATALVGGAVAGWVLNIVKLAGAAEADGLTLLGVMRALGIFLLPLGAVLGYLN